MLLGTLEEAEGSANLSDLSERFGCTRQNIRQLVDALASKGFVRTEKAADDKRETLVILAEGAAQSAPRPPLEEERSLVYRSSMPDGQKVDALLLLNGLERAKRDGELYCALLAGYLWFAKCTGWKSEHLAALADDLARRKEDL